MLSFFSCLSKCDALSRNIKSSLRSMMLLFQEPAVWHDRRQRKLEIKARKRRQQEEDFCERIYHLRHSTMMLALREVMNTVYTIYTLGVWIALGQCTSIPNWLVCILVSNSVMKACESNNDIPICGKTDTSWWGAGWSRNPMSWVCPCWWNTIAFTKFCEVWLLVYLLSFMLVKYTFFYCVLLWRGQGRCPLAS